MEQTQPDGRTARKRRAILDAARTLFLRNGFAGTSMDDVAAMAEVSKQTVYKHFADKQSLFAELITLDISQMEVDPHPLELAMPGTDDLEHDLREYARMHLSVVMQPPLLRMRRVLIGEADRFPHLARAWYENGPERSCAIFAGWFEALDRRGLLHAPDPMLAAQHFNWLVLSIPLNKAMSMPVEGAMFSDDELRHYADAGVRVFLAAYASGTAASAVNGRKVNDS
ncbi:TetR/AcrR family transcriptional regulator [Nonomuraea typhae]|uniref:TetR/AcrR family transcriptional regulator n=1 Tax=Nonomuraea typhae TaxID=2603600 RepID=A0ABW7YZ99_9ACTN